MIAYVNDPRIQLVEDTTRRCSNRLTRDQIIDRIQSQSPGAKREFLIGFDRDALASYLEHLMYLQEPRGRTARWVRTGETRAIEERVPAGDD